MHHPPLRSRRTRRRRWLLVLCVGAALLAAGTGVAQWRGDGFPARTQWLAGTPVELHVQPGVTPREVRAIGDGVRFVDRFVRRSLGRSVRGPVEARVARQDTCRSSDSRDRELIGQGSRGFICVDTANFEWQALINEDPLAARAVSGHEYVHALQAELGCLPDRDEREYGWLVEGMATHLAWRAAVAARRATEAHVRRTIRRDGAFDESSGPLRHYERAGGRTPQYALWHAAVRLLMREATRSGAAPAARPERALRAFCEGVAAGSPWRAAFAHSFGIPLEEFYARFEAARPGR